MWPDSGAATIQIAYSSLVLPYFCANKMLIDIHVEEKNTVIWQNTIEWIPSDANKHKKLSMLILLSH